MTAVTANGVFVSRKGDWWVFENPALGTAGEAHDLADVQREVIGVIATWVNVDPETVAVDITFKG